MRESLECLGIQGQDTEQQLKEHDTAIEKNEMLLQRSTSGQIVQPNKFLDKVIEEEDDQDDKVDTLNTGILSEFDFEKNQQLFNYVSVKQINWLHQMFPNQNETAPIKS